MPHDKVWGGGGQKANSSGNEYLLILPYRWLSMPLKKNNWFFATEFIMIFSKFIADFTSKRGEVYALSPASLTYSFTSIPFPCNELLWELEEKNQNSTLPQCIFTAFFTARTMRAGRWNRYKNRRRKHRTIAREVVITDNIMNSTVIKIIVCARFWRHWLYIIIYEEKTNFNKRYISL